ncbi:MAG: hypothetical protein HY329_14605 [Chloroflexi bacterium]|nr:hypothetical protein [Chloroflexota bacterium]
MNYDGKESLEDVLQRCRREGGNIQVGHTGGELDLQSRGYVYARHKNWKWRDRRTNKGRVTPSNWIAGDRFVEIIDRLQRSTR